MVNGTVRAASLLPLSSPLQNLERGGGEAKRAVPCETALSATRRRRLFLRLVVPVIGPRLDRLCRRLGDQSHVVAELRPGQVVAEDVAGERDVEQLLAQVVRQVLDLALALGRVELAAL